MKKVWTRVLFVVGLLFVSPVLNAQSGAKNGEWRSYAGDTGSTRYSPLDQINAANFNTLEIAWRFKTDNLGPRPEYQYEGTPLMVGGVLYATAGSRRAVVALNPVDRASAYTDLAEGYLKSGKRAEARKQTLAALEIAPSYERAQTLLLQLSEARP